MCDKLTVVAQEILAAFEKTLEGHEAEIARQRKMLETFFSPEIKSHQTGRCMEWGNHKLSSFFFFALLNGGSL